MLQTKEYKIIELKDGVYLKSFEVIDYQEYTVNFTSDSEESYKFDLYDLTINNIARKIFGVVKILKVTYNTNGCM